MKKVSQSASLASFPLTEGAERPDVQTSSVQTPGVVNVPSGAPGAAPAATSTTAAPLLQARGLRCDYGQREVLHGLDLAVYPHQRLCVLGPNGCGKTTLLRALAGLLPITGQVLLRTDTGVLDVHRARRAAVARRLALLSQTSPAPFTYTVYETVLLGRWAHRRGLLASADAADHALVEQSLRRTGLWPQRDALITQLSGGQLQRVYLARAFAQAPSVILLDEPTNHLDLKYQLELVDYLTQWAAEGDRCVVGVLHDINLALAFADSLLLLADGRPLASGPADGFDLRLLNDLFGLDVGAYMRTALARWDAENAESAENAGETF